VTPVEGHCQHPRRDPLGLGILLAAASEVAFAVLHRTGATADGIRKLAPTQGLLAATLLASAGQPSWRVPVLANASLHHVVKAGSGRSDRSGLRPSLSRVVDVAWAAALGALLREARRAERWDT
jgi:hypothetical protein